LGLQGAALNLKLRATKPCEGDCVILNMDAALENEEGMKLDVSDGVSITDESFAADVLMPLTSRSSSITP
jgi:hypothetical protein